MTPAGFGEQPFGTSPFGVGWRDITVTIGRLSRRAVTAGRLSRLVLSAGPLRRTP